MPSTIWSSFFYRTVSYPKIRTLSLQNSHFFLLFSSGVLSGPSHWRNNIDCDVKVTVTLCVLCALWRPVCGTNCACTKCTLHTLSIIQHVSAHHTFHRQGVFVVIIKMLSNGPLYDKWNSSEWHTCTHSRMLWYQLRRLPDEGTGGVSIHVRELTRCEGYIWCTESWFCKMTGWGVGEENEERIGV
jgi:hypothetical protein